MTTNHEESLGDSSGSHRWTLVSLLASFAHLAHPAHLPVTKQRRSFIEHRHSSLHGSTRTIVDGYTARITSILSGRRVEVAIIVHLFVFFVVVIVVVIVFTQIFTSLP